MLHHFIVLYSESVCRFRSQNMEADALDELVDTVANVSSISSTLFTTSPSPLQFTPSTAVADIGMMNKPLVKASFLVVYILVFFSWVIFRFSKDSDFRCVIGNSMILIVIIANKSMRTVTNFFLANLAVADLLVGIFCVCQNAAHFVMFEHGTWPFGRVLCHAYVYILHMIPNSSAGILVGANPWDNDPKLTGTSFYRAIHCGSAADARAPSHDQKRVGSMRDVSVGLLCTIQPSISDGRPILRVEELRNRREIRG